MAQSITTPWQSSATATKTLSGLPDLIARHTDTAKADTRQFLADGTWRTAETVTSHDDATGLPTKVDDKGAIDSDGAPVGGSTPESCTTTSYASDPDRNMLGFAAQTITNQGPCSTSVDSTTIAASRNYYDGATTLGTLTGPGSVTSSQSLEDGRFGWRCGMDDAGQHDLRCLRPYAHQRRPVGPQRIHQLRLHRHRPQVPSGQDSRHQRGRLDDHHHAGPGAAAAADHVRRQRRRGDQHLRRARPPDRRLVTRSPTEREPDPAFREVLLPGVDDRAGGDHHPGVAGNPQILGVGLDRRRAAA